MKDPWFFTRQQLMQRSGYIGGRVLDVGSGHSKYEHVIRRYAKRYYAVDRFRNAAQIKGSVEHLPFGESVFDTLICTQLIEHVPRPWVAVAEMYRILKPGGYLILSAPWIYPYHGSPADYYRFSRDGLRALLEDNGFKVIDLCPMGGGFLVAVEYFNAGMWQYNVSFLKRRMLQLFYMLASIIERPSNKSLNTPNHIVVAGK